LNVRFIQFYAIILIAPSTPTLELYLYKTHVWCI